MSNAATLTRELRFEARDALLLRAAPVDEVRLREDFAGQQDNAESQPGPGTEFSQDLQNHRRSPLSSPARSGLAGRARRRAWRCAIGLVVVCLIAKHVLGLHGAHLTIESEVGIGSTFSCIFPGERCRTRPSALPSN